jgi:hypothetical protein
LNTYLNNVDSPTRRNHTPTAPPIHNPARFGVGSPGYRRPFQRNPRVHALIGYDHPKDTISDPSDLDPFAFEPYLDQIVCKLSGNGPKLRHCMFYGPTKMHLFDKCPILNDKRISSTLATRLGSTYQRMVKEAVLCQKEANEISVDIIYNSYVQN